MTYTMPALVLNGPGDVQVAEKPIPTPGPGEVVLAVEATTICGTDLRIISGEKTAGVRPGVTLGHEIAGRIASLGEGVVCASPSGLSRQHHPGSYGDTSYAAGPGGTSLLCS